MSCLKRLGYRFIVWPRLVTTNTLERLAKRGYESMLEHYLKVAPQFNEPLYTRPAWFILSAAEEYSGGAYAEASAQACERRTPS